MLALIAVYVDSAHDTHYVGSHRRLSRESLVLNAHARLSVGASGLVCIDRIMMSLKAERALEMFLIFQLTNNESNQQAHRRNKSMEKNS